MSIITSVLIWPMAESIVQKETDIKIVVIVREVVIARKSVEDYCVEICFRSDFVETLIRFQIFFLVQQTLLGIPLLVILLSVSLH